MEKSGIWALAMVLCIGTILVWLKSWIRGVILALRLPGPKALPLIGNAHLAVDSKKFEMIGRTMYTKYGPIMRGWLSVIPSFFIVEPKDIQQVLASSKHEKNFLYTLLHNFVGEGLITNNGNKWKSHRKLIQPYFTINILETFINTFSESAKIAVEQLKGKEEINITGYVNECIIDILHHSVMGIPIRKSANEKSKMESPFRQGKVTVPYRIVRPWLLINVFYNATKFAKTELSQKRNLQVYTKKVLEERRTNKDTHDPEENFRCLMEILMEIQENNPNFTDEDIVNEVCTFMLAGQDSVGSAAAFSLYLLAKHQDIQEKVFEEINCVYYSGSSLTMNDLNKLKYLEQCVRETLRMYPSVPLIARKLFEDVKIADYVIPKGNSVFISPFATQRLPHIYPNPDEFDPERFSFENQQKLHPYAFLPFSAGPRNCIGYKFAILELKSILAVILKHYHVSLKPGYELELNYRLTLRAKGGIWLRLRPRN